MEILNELNKIATEKFGKEVKINISKTPNWENAPEWAKWLSQDADGIWKWFSTKPEPHNFGLYVKGTFIASGKGKSEYVETGGTHILTNPNKNWKRTITKRPNPKNNNV